METPALNGMKIALTCSGLSHVRRGVEAWSEQAFSALRRRGLDVTLFKGSGANGHEHVAVVPCIRRDSPLSRTLSRVLPSASWRIGLGSPYQMEQTTFAVSAFGALARRFDLVHTKDPQVALLLHLARKAGWSRARVILNHGTEEPPEFLSRFDYLQHLAPPHLEDARRQGVRATHQFVVPNFVDTGTFSPGEGGPLRDRLGIPRGALVLLCVAAIKRHHKRLEWLLTEASRVRPATGRELYVLVVGARTDETPAVQQLGRELLGSRAVFLVDAPREQMPDLYRAANLFVLCSLKEMLANALLEALASGLPCLMHREPVAQWAIGAGGVTIDMTAPGELAATVTAYLNDSLRRQAAAEARRKALACFATDVVLEQQVAMYRNVLAH